MIFCFDIDDTLLYSSVDEKGNYTFERSNVDLIDFVNHLYKKGHTIILHTGRHWNHLRVTIEQIQEAGIMYHTLVMAKPYADYYIDDKAITPEEFLNIPV